MPFIANLMFILQLLGDFHVFMPVSAIKEHGVVYPTILEGRWDEGGRVLKIKDEIILNLKKSELFAGDFLFRTETSGKEVHYYMKREDYEKDLYHDDVNMASVIVNTDSGVQVEGILSNTLRVEPLLEMPRSETGQVPHRLYEVLPQKSYPSDRDYAIPNITSRDMQAGLYAEARRTRRTMYAEIYLVIDRDFAKAYAFSQSKITAYFAISLNACNLRFKTMESPRIRLRLVGITVFKTEAPFIVRAPENPEVILDEKTLEAFNIYYRGKDVYVMSDLMFFISGGDIGYHDYYGRLITETAGYTYVGGACQDDRVGMCEELPKSYYGAYLMTHEIAHSFGCVHDGTEAVALPGHRGALQCPAEDGFLMSYAKKDENQYRFSDCCKADMRNLLNHPKWSCLKKRSKKSIKKYGLPGEYINGETYCRSCYRYDSRMRYDREYGVQNCQVHCEGTYSYILGVPDGAPCDKLKKGAQRCLLGRCVQE
ncbi:venom metalloproteinase antarease TserMP_A-like [Haemaphysalis longicornis]